MKKGWFLLAAVLLLIGCGKKPADNAPRVGKVVVDTIADIPCYVYLPKGCKGNGVKYPVLYLQHGMWGNETDWTTQGRLLELTDSLLALGEIREMVVVMPDNCPSRPTYEEEKANATNGYWENHFAEFMAETESRYPVSTKPEERAIAGLSMGGYHTMKVATTLNGEFAYVGMFSPATFMNEAPTQPKVLWLGIGNEDFLYDMVMGYRRWLEQNHYEYVYYESAGGHTWDNWQDYFCRFAKLIFK